ncbi:MAG: aminopeptidase, partial [Spirochaetales bacterium]|nr:aminopeptidase [Candidatus Physcosoma equi]
MTEQLFAERLADLVLTKGINLEEGMCLNINTCAETYFYARVMAEDAYRKGAKYVKITVTDPYLDKARTQYRSDKDLSFVPNYERAFNLEAAAASWANVRLESPEEHIGVDIKDVKKMQIITNSKRETKKELSQKYMGSQLPWCVCCVPGPK